MFGFIIVFLDDGMVSPRDGTVSPRIPRGSPQSLANFPVPASITDIRAFLGFSGFHRRFIQAYACIANPLTALTKTTHLVPLTL
jgi:hypothetical protein